MESAPGTGSQGGPNRWWMVNYASVPKYLKHFPQPLLDELVSGRWLPLVGAGLSKTAELASGRAMPLWDDLGKAVASDIAGHEYVGAIDAISAYEHEFGRRELVRRLHRELLVDEARPGEAHRAFSRLRFDRVVTTNFEFLLEQGYEAVGERCDVVLDEEQLPIPTPKNGTVLVKLHGDLRHPRRLVATEDDYDGFLARYPVLATHVASLLVDRVPVLIGYSLDDPDLRQLLALLRERLGPMLPNAYVLVVAPAAATIARYARRGIKVVGLPGSRERYGDVVAAALTELDEYWRDRALEDASFTEERPLEQIETALDRKASRLAYFSIPLSLLAFYRDEIFPLAEQAGWVPVSGFDVEVRAGNLLAAIRALLETSRLAVVDMTEGAGATELGAAISALGGEKVLVVASSRTPSLSVAGGLEVIYRPLSLAEGRQEFLGRIAEWFERRAIPAPEPGSEAENLLRHSQWRAAMIAAISDLEVILMERFGASTVESMRGTFGPRRPTFRSLIASEELPLDQELRGRLFDWSALRNSALHQRRAISAPEARGAVADVEAVRRLI